MKTKVLIIGGGPSGASAGIHLLRLGVECLIVDKAVFPREKLCGGLITEKSVRLLESWGFDDFHDIVEEVVRDVNILDCGEKVISVHPRCPFNIVRRFDFDNWLLGKYMEAGGQVLMGEQVRKINFKEKNVETTKRKIEFDYIIGADGCNGLTSHLVNHDELKLALGVECVIPENEDTSIDLDVGIAKNGYAWRFPRGDETVYGYAFSYNKDFDYSDYAKRKFPEGAKIVGAYLPYGTKCEHVTDERGIILVGDAAGYIDAITGEGTYYALQSGLLAAQAFISASPVLTYKRTSREICDNVWRSWGLINKFYNHRKTILKLAKQHPNFVAYACDHLVSLKVTDYNILKLFWDYKKTRNDQMHTDYEED